MKNYKDYYNRMDSVELTELVEKNIETLRRLIDSANIFVEWGKESNSLIKAETVLSSLEDALINLIDFQEAQDKYNE